MNDIKLESASELSPLGFLSTELKSTDDPSPEHAGENLKGSEEGFRNLTQALPHLVWVTDATGRQEFASDRWKEYTGLDPHGQYTWEKIIHPDDANSLSQAWNYSLQSGNTYKAEIRLLGKDGNYRWFHVHGEPIRSEKNEILQWVGAFTDIHEQKLAEEKLRDSEERLEYLVKKRTEELERSNEDLQQFAHVASHDLKEPLRKIKIYSSLLSDEFGSQFIGKAGTYLAKIQTASDRMLQMMEGVLRYAGMDGSQQSIENIDLNEILDSIEMDLEIVIEKKKALIRRHHLPLIQGYHVLIYQLFYNLFSNALKFSRADVQPVIEITYKNTIKDNLPFNQITIQDNGIGFEQANSEKIFYSFARLNAREDYEGTGLGLSLCKKIVIRHQGYIVAKGKPNDGAVFTVLLPAILPFV